MQRLRLLWVTPDLPRRGVSASRTCWWALLAHLAPRHDITLLALVDPAEATDRAALPAGLADAHLVPRRRYTPDDPYALLPQAVAGGSCDPALRDAIAARLATARFDLAQYEFAETSYLIPPSATPAVLAVPQLGFAAQGPRWRAEGGGLRHAAVLLHRYLRELDFELRAVARADHVVTVSPQDATRLRRFLPDLPVSVVPVGVDTDTLRPEPPADGRRSDLLFVGNFIHPPNADAVRFLAREIVPRLGGGMRVHVVGHGGEAAVAALGAGNVTALGPVDDLRPWLAGATVVVAPVRFGTGMRGKVLEALAMGRPVVTTALGAEGLGAVDGRHLLVANDAAAFAAAVRRVLGDPALQARLGAEGRALVEARFDWDVVARTMEDVHQRVLRSARSETRPRAFAIPARPLLRGPLAIGAGGLRLVGRAGAWHARRLRGSRPAAADRHVALAG